MSENSLCPICKNELKLKQIYCSRECYKKSRYKLFICKICKKEIMIGSKNNNKVYCSLSCMNSDKERYKNIKEKVKITMMKKYGVEYPSQMKNHFDKVKNTLSERYGVDHPTRIPGYKEKLKKTLLEKHGIENYNNMEKNKETKLKRYGNEKYNNREKYKETLIKKYGSNINPLISKANKEKSKKGILGFQTGKYKETLMEKYGVINTSQIEEVKEKIKKKTWENMYNSLFEEKRISELLTPLFSFNDYKGCGEEYLFKCLGCNQEFYSNLTDGRIPRCYICNPRYSERSLKQKEVYDFLKSILPEDTIICYNDRTILDNMELDIYIPSHNLAIEFDGLYCHSELSGKKDRNYHLDKTNLCLSKGVRLIHLFEDEWIFKQDIVRNRLRHILNLTSDRIYARNCLIKEIDTKQKNEFLNNYHLQGEDKSSIKLGAFYGDDELVAVMTFGANRIALGKSNIQGEYELYRFCQGEKQVIGIAGKLLHYFIENYKPEKISTYSDKRWGDAENGLYSQIGFSYVGDTIPNYWYFNENLYRQHRFSFRKNVLNERLDTFDPIFTEWENMQLNNYDRIWDCGNMKFEWKNY